MNPVIDKLTSGRLWLTIIAGIVFAYCSINKTLNAECIASIVTAVFLSYFQRSDRKKEENGNNSTPLL